MCTLFQVTYPFTSLPSRGLLRTFLFFLPHTSEASYTVYTPIHSRVENQNFKN